LRLYIMAMLLEFHLSSSNNSSMIVSGPDGSRVLKVGRAAT